MEPFHPGAEYGYPYEVLVWVCTNPVPRTFDRCDLAQGHAVLETFRQKLAQRGLGRRSFVFNSGCMLGCKPQGTTVAILIKDPGQAKPDRTRFLRNVTPGDVDTIRQQEILVPLQQH